MYNNIFSPIKAMPVPKLVGTPVPTKVSGLIEPGNINLNDRPKVKNSDGTISTILSVSFNEDGKEVLIPRVIKNGTIVSPKEAWNNYLKTGEHLGKFDSVKSANNYAQQLHLEQQKQMKNPILQLLKFLLQIK